jgi:hypothetical protein
MSENRKVGSGIRRLWEIVKYFWNNLQIDIVAWVRAVVVRAFALLKGLKIFAKNGHLVTFSLVKRTPIYFFFPYISPHLD